MDFSRKKGNVLLKLSRGLGRVPGYLNLFGINHQQ